MPQLAAIPTNVITGFLGVGKTSAILNLLKTKPQQERWAVLVNEFGEVGVDGSLFSGQHSEQQGVFIREVPGGCMCCTAGLSMQIALNQLLTRAKPDRLLIEPTGLGHPMEVLQILSSEYYRDVLDLQKVITLVDARKLANPRYTTHQTFNQQIAIADVVVGNKADLYGDNDGSALQTYVLDHGMANAKLMFTEQGVIEPALLEGAAAAKVESPAHVHTQESESMAIEEPLPESGFIQALNEGEGFSSVGWRFSPAFTFDRDRLFAFFSGLEVERLKAVVITSDGVFGYNLTEDALTEFELDDCLETKVEIIAGAINSDWEQELKDCIL